MFLCYTDDNNPEVYPWNKIQINLGKLNLHYTKIGSNKNGYFLIANIIDNSNKLSGVLIKYLDTNFIVKQFWNLDNNYYSLLPLEILDQTDEMFCLELYSTNKLRLFKFIYNKNQYLTPYSLTYNIVEIPFFNFSSKIYQPETTTSLNSHGDKILSAVLKNGLIYAAHCYQYNEKNVGIRWYQINPLTTFLLNYGEIIYTSPNGFKGSCWMPSLSVDSYNTILITFSVLCEGGKINNKLVDVLYPSVGYVSVNFDSSNIKSQSEIFIKQFGEASYLIESNYMNCSQVTVDNNNVFYNLNEYLSKKSLISNLLSMATYLNPPVKNLKDSNNALQFYNKKPNINKDINKENIVTKTMQLSVPKYKYNNDFTIDTLAIENKLNLHKKKPTKTTTKIVKKSNIEKNIKSKINVKKPVNLKVILKKN